MPYFLMVSMVYCCKHGSGKIYCNSFQIIRIFNHYNEIRVTPSCCDAIYSYTDLTIETLHLIKFYIPYNPILPLFVQTGQL